MLSFDAGSFSDLSETEQGRLLWARLNSQEALSCMKTATYLGRPALEALQPLLIKQFGNNIKPDRWKQIAGRMVRQILEHHGYVLDQTGVRTKGKELFTSASRYRNIKENTIPLDINKKQKPETVKKDDVVLLKTMGDWSCLITAKILSMDGETIIAEIRKIETWDKIMLNGGAPKRCRMVGMEQFIGTNIMLGKENIYEDEEDQLWPNA